MTTTVHGRQQLKALWVGIVALAGLLGGLFAFTLSLAEQAGEVKRQVEINKESIENLQKYGSPGVRDRLSLLEQRTRDIDTHLDTVDIRLNSHMHGR